MQLIEDVACERAGPVTVTKVEEMREIVGYGVMSTPAVVNDGKVVHAGACRTVGKSGSGSPLPDKEYVAGGECSTGRAWAACAVSPAVVWQDA